MKEEELRSHFILTPSGLSLLTCESMATKRDVVQISSYSRRLKDNVKSILDNYGEILKASKVRILNFYFGHDDWVTWSRDLLILYIYIYIYIYIYRSLRVKARAVNMRLTCIVLRMRLRYEQQTW